MNYTRKTKVELIQELLNAETRLTSQKSMCEHLSLRVDGLLKDKDRAAGLEALLLQRSVALGDAERSGNALRHSLDETAMEEGENVERYFQRKEAWAVRIRALAEGKMP